MAYASITSAASGDNTVIPAVTGKKIQVERFVITSAGTVNAKWRSGTTDISGLFYLVANSGATCPGTGDFASAPSSVGLQNAVDYRVWAQLNNWASGAVQKLLGKWNTGTGGYLLEVDATGTVTFALNTGGTQIFTTSSSLGLANGSRKWVRATWNAATGQAIVYTSDDGSNWTTVQTFSGSAAGLASNAEAVTVGADAAAAQPVTGKIYRATLLSSIGGATVGDFNPGAVTRTGVRTPTTYTDPQGNVWTVNGTGWDWV
jgi:hypothetical protein